MESGAIIEGFDVVEDGRARLGITGEALMIDQLVFEAAPEGLDEGIVVAIALAAHGGDEPVLSQELPVSRAGELAAAIGEKAQSTGGPALT